MLRLQGALGGGPRDTQQRMLKETPHWFCCAPSLPVQSDKTAAPGSPPSPSPPGPGLSHCRDPRAAWHSFICGGGTGTLEGPSSERAVGLEMEYGTDGPGDEGFPQPHARALGIYSSWNHLQAHGTLFPAFIASSAPSPSAPSSGKVFLSCRCLK